MSGTSVDGIDAALVDLSTDPPLLVAARTFAWPRWLRDDILATIDNRRQLSLLNLGRLDAAIGDEFAKAALAMIAEAQLDPSALKAIGSHGQTLFHAPDEEPAFSMQLGDPNRIAEATGVVTVADFRRRDIAAGGQGAPLVPAFHQALFHDRSVSRAILNIGGMANLTLLPKEGDAITGFDTGPGNVLLDSWYGKHREPGFDRGGRWAKGGELNQALLDELLTHPYFAQTPPKSTGRETFCLSWLERIMRAGYPTLAAEDVQRTLVELTVQSVALSLEHFAVDVEQVLVCGGGVHNGFLMQRLEAQLAPRRVASTESYGLHPDWVEAVAFAWLARQTVLGKAGNVPGVTGAKRPAVLGAIYPGRDEGSAG
jgi:anhydro-N-acetylmuramic acid kinase